MKEIWKAIVNYENYDISNLGKVRNNLTGRILKPIKTVYGYYEVGLRKCNKTKIFKVHRLVGIHFLDKPYGKDFINHINGIKTDNNINNLEWCTRNENQIHSHLVLGNSDKSKRMLYQYDKDFNLIGVFQDAYEAARITNIFQQNINSCALGKLKSSGGYIWKYQKLPYNI